MHTCVYVCNTHIYIYILMPPWGSRARRQVFPHNAIQRTEPDPRCYGLKNLNFPWVFWGCPFWVSLVELGFSPEVVFSRFSWKSDKCTCFEKVKISLVKSRFSHFACSIFSKNTFPWFWGTFFYVPSKQRNVFLLWKSMKFLWKNKLFGILQTTLRSFADSANDLKVVCRIFNFLEIRRRSIRCEKKLVFLRKT